MAIPLRMEMERPPKCCRCGMRDPIFLWTCNNCPNTFCGAQGANHIFDEVAHPCIKVARETGILLRFTSVSDPSDTAHTVTYEQLARKAADYAQPRSLETALQIARLHLPGSRHPNPAIVMHMAACFPDIKLQIYPETPEQYVALNTRLPANGSVRLYVGGDKNKGYTAFVVPAEDGLHTYIPLDAAHNTLSYRWKWRYGGEHRWFTVIRHRWHKLRIDPARMTAIADDHRFRAIGINMGPAPLDKEWFDAYEPGRMDDMRHIVEWGWVDVHLGEIEGDIEFSLAGTPFRISTWGFESDRHCSWIRDAKGFVGWRSCGGRCATYSVYDSSGILKSGLRGVALKFVGM